MCFSDSVSQISESFRLKFKTKSTALMKVKKILSEIWLYHLSNLQDPFNLPTSFTFFGINFFKCFLLYT